MGRRQRRDGSAWVGGMGQGVGPVRSGGRKKKNEREKSTGGLGRRRVEEEVVEAGQLDGAWLAWVSNRSAMGCGLRGSMMAD